MIDGIHGDGDALNLSSLACFLCLSRGFYRDGLLFDFLFFCWLSIVVVVCHSKYHLLSCMKSGNIVLECLEFDLSPNYFLHKSVLHYLTSSS